MVHITTPSPKTINIARGPMAGKGENVMTNYDKAVLKEMIKEARNLNCSYKEQKLIAAAISLYAQGKKDLCLTLLMQKGLDALFGAWARVASEYVVKKEATK